MCRSALAHAGGTFCGLNENWRAFDRRTGGSGDARKRPGTELKMTLPEFGGRFVTISDASSAR